MPKTWKKSEILSKLSENFPFTPYFFESAGRHKKWSSFGKKVQNLST